MKYSLRHFSPMTLFGILAIALLLITGAAIAENMGAPDLVVKGGPNGNIALPHAVHQKAVTDCMVCHKDFPQKAGSLTLLKEEGKLKPKQVMNQTCIKCHRALKNKGKASGPTTCSNCHTL